MTQAGVIAVPQMSYLELITFQIGNRRIGDYWQRFSGGQVQVASTRSAPPNKRSTKPMSGKYSIADVSMEREYTPNDSHVNTLISLLNHLKDPGNPNNDIKLIREINNGPMGNNATKTKITYLGCVPTAIPILEDGDTTADAQIMPTRISFAVEDIIINIGGTEIDLMSAIGGGFNTSGSGTGRAIQALSFINTSTGSTATPV
jgi:hypothetical protein